MTDGWVDNTHRGVLIAARVRARWKEGGLGGGLHLAQQSRARTRCRLKQGSQRWCGTARIVRTLVSERSWMGFPDRGNHATAAWRSKGTSPHVKLTQRGGGCTWRRAQRRMVPAHVHAHTWQGMQHVTIQMGLVGTLLGSGITVQRRQRCLMSMRSVLAGRAWLQALSAEWQRQTLHHVHVEGTGSSRPTMPR
jgi:hypothetical protein